MSQASNVERPPWTNLQGDYELRNKAEFSATPGGKTSIIDLSPPALPTPTRNRKILLIVGLVLAVFDIFILPIVFFYSLTYGSSLTARYGKQRCSRRKEGTSETVTDFSLRVVFIVITCLFCMMTFAHYTHRCVRLILKCSIRYGPIGWQRKWRLVR
jgi:hypothetical protein